MTVWLDDGDPYCPFEGVADPSTIGLKPGRFQDPTFGSIAYRIRDDANSIANEGTVFLHGVGGTLSSWTPLLQQAAEDGVLLGTVVLVDLPGFGGSENLAASLDAFAVSDMLVRLTDHLGLTRVHLVGQSIGGYLALTITSRHEERVLTATVFSGTLFRLAETSGRWARIATTLLRGRRRRATYSAAKMTGALVRRLAWIAAVTGVLRLNLTKVAADPAHVPIGLLKSIARGIRPECYLVALENTLKYKPIKYWSTIPPTKATVAYGESDRMGGSTGEVAILHEACPNIRTVILPHCGHFLHIEQPRAALRLLVADRNTDELRQPESATSSSPVSAVPARVGIRDILRTWREDLRRHAAQFQYWNRRVPVISAPLWLPMLTLALTRGSEAIRQPGCGTLSIVQLIGSTPNRTKTPCTAAVFAADLPSIGLATGCVALFILHFRWKLAFKELDLSLRNGRLIKNDARNIVETAPVGTPTRPKYVVLYLISIILFACLVLYFYYRTYNSHNLVRDLEKHQISILDGEPPTVDQKTWWADFHGWNVINAVAWCVVGTATLSIGMFDQFRLGRITPWFKRNASCLTSDYEPIYRTDNLNDDPFGLNCVYTLIELKRWGGAVLCASLVTMFYLIRTPGRVLYNFNALILLSIVLIIWYIPLHQLRRFVERHLHNAVECARTRYARGLDDPRRSFEITHRDRFELEQIMALASAGNRSILGSWTQRVVFAVTVLAALGGVYPVLIGT